MKDTRSINTSVTGRVRTISYIRKIETYNFRGVPQSLRRHEFAHQAADVLGVKCSAWLDEAATRQTKTPNSSSITKSKHGKYLLRLKGLRPKTIDAYARAIRRIGNYLDARIDHLTSES